MPGVGVRYTGGGVGGSLPNIPARDLSAGEVAALGGVDALIATGLYEAEWEPESEQMAGDEEPVEGVEWQE